MIERNAASDEGIDIFSRPALLIHVWCDIRLHDVWTNASGCRETRVAPDISHLAMYHGSTH